ncbi:MAG: DUF1549 and DUF1553 domain-containing protein, partial [Planctomycetota bacterium]
GQHFIRTVQAAEPLFAIDGMAALSQGGCNQGACHGNLHGKGGFKLSLRGQDPAVDHATITHEQAGRRINLLEPEQSLLLLKATGRVAHQGGVRFSGDSPAYQALRDWIASGARFVTPQETRIVALNVEPAEAILVEPVDRVTLKVTATDAQGQRRDVTALTTFEASNLIPLISASGEVRRQQLGETTILARFLDQQVPVRVAFLPARTGPLPPLEPPLTPLDRPLHDRWAKLQTTPSAAVDDATWLRRLYLDTLGILPTADEAREFVADRTVDKREQLIDRVVHRPEFTAQWALKWCDILRVEEKVLDVTGVDVFHRWLSDRIRTATPINQLVGELLTARGSTYEYPAANFYRANRDAAARGETTARLFLGVRLQCAQCHNHPYDRWTQDDYYSWAALFGRVDYQILSNDRADKLDKNEFNGEQVVEVKEAGEVKNARTGRDAEPRLLGANLPALPANSDRLDALSHWLTSRDNRMFAQAQANFIWYHLLGRGVVEPIDDVRATNPPSVPGLLEYLGTQLIEHDFDLRHLVREIVTSGTYARSVGATDLADDEGLFARAIVRRWSAEKLLDAQSQVLDQPAPLAGYPLGLRAAQVPGVKRVKDNRSGEGDRFLATFGKPARLLGCECERSNETTLKQAFWLLSGQELNERISAPSNRLSQWAHSSATKDELIVELYWTVLTREPTDREKEAARQWLSDSADRSTALQDLTWALLNAKEFLFRH